MKFTLDLHTHTVASGHAYSTVQEMAKAAADKGLKLLGITEHAQGIPGTCDEIYFHNMRIIPRKMYGIDLMFGSEINIIDHDGTLSMEEKIIEKTLDIRIAGIHLPCYEVGTVTQNTNAYVKAIENPRNCYLSLTVYDFLLPHLQSFHNQSVFCCHLDD